jgi:hypothetical protein
MLFIVDGSTKWDGFAMCVGAGLSVLLINVLFRFGAAAVEQREPGSAGHGQLTRAALANFCG